MDETPHPPKSSPYRAEKPLDQIIPPDRRREKTIALVLASMVAGVAVWTLGGRALDWLGKCSAPTVVATPTTFVSGKITPALLQGPGGPQRVPLPQVHVVNVWLQGCQDCMPAFEAMRDLQDRGGLGLHVPVLNVAYGEADQTWAHRYGVGGDLLFDGTGTVFVKPLGIGTFTTLVIDGNGNVIHRDRPDRPGYRERVRAAVGERELDPSDPHVAPVEPFGPEAVERVVAAHRTGIRRLCWEKIESAEPVLLSVWVTVAPDGTVSSTSAPNATSPTAKKVAACVQKQMQSWTFPPPGATKTVDIPFRFVRQ